MTTPTEEIVPMKVVLYSVATLLQGVRASFKLARELGIRYLEVFPYQWTTANQLFRWQKRYNIQIVGIDERFWWNRSLRQVIRAENHPMEWAMACAWRLLFGRGDDRRTIKLIRALKPQPGPGFPFWIVHHDVVSQMGESEFRTFLKEGVVSVVENERPKRGYDQLLWDPRLIADHYRPLGCKIALDPRHIRIASQQLGLVAGLDPLKLFREVRPEAMHFSFGAYLNYALAPEHEIQIWLEQFEFHRPEWLVLETSPLPGQRKRLSLTLNLFREHQLLE